MLTTKQFEELLMAQASHQIADHFHQQCTKTQLIEIYSAAYKFHKAEDGLLRDFYPRLCSSVVDRALVAKGRQVDARQTDPTLVSWLANSGGAQAVEVGEHTGVIQDRT